MEDLINYSYKLIYVSVCLMNTHKGLLKVGEAHTYHRYKAG
jgi:hypothetical protein